LHIYIIGYDKIKTDENRLWTVLVIVIVVTWVGCNNIIGQAINKIQINNKIILWWKNFLKKMHLVIYIMLYLIQ